VKRDQVESPAVFSDRSACIGPSSNDCVVSLVEGSTIAEVVLLDADLALQVRRYVALWLERRLVGQCLPIRPRLDMAPATPAWLHPDIQATYGWFGFRDGAGDVHWVPWSIIRSARATAEAMSVVVSTDSDASWNVRCPSFGNATAIARIITGCSRSPVVERALHADIRIIGKTLCLACGNAGETAGQLLLDWQSISVVRVEVVLSLSISVVDPLAAPGESRILSFSFPDEAAVTLAAAWIDWWWKLRPPHYRPGEALCHLAVEPVALDAAQRLEILHGGLMRHTDFPAKPPCESKRDLGAEKKRKAAAKRSVDEGDVNRANAILTTNTPRREMDNATFNQLAALQLDPPAHLEPLRRMPGAATPTVTLEGIRAVISVLNARAAAGVSGSTNR
jgi:hypothetical protein